MRRVSVVLLLFALFATLPTTTSADAPKGMITIRAHICPHGYVHQEYSQICSDRPLVNTLFQVSPASQGEGSIRTDSMGIVVFSLTPGTYVFAGPPGDFLDDQFLTCSPTQESAGPHGPVTLTSGGNVICDYYMVPGRNCAVCPPTPTPPADAGHIQYFHAFVCDRDPGYPRVQGEPFSAANCSTPRGIALTATTGDGRTIGTCITEQDGYCALHVPVPIVILSEDLNTVPKGYAPEENPLLQNPGENDLTIVNVPLNAFPTVSPANSSITVHGRVCPPSYDGTDYFGDCHSNLPNYPQMMFLSGGYGAADYLAKTIDAEATVTFRDLVPEPYILRLGLPPDTIAARVLCSTSDAPGKILDLRGTYTIGWATTTIPLFAGQDITCDAYTIPPAG